MKLPNLRSKKVIGGMLILTAAGGYFIYQRLTAEEGTTRYVTAAAERGTISVTIGGTGQVSVSDQVDITPKASGEITALYVTEGQEVKAGALIAHIDSRDAYNNVRDAQTSLETAELELERLLEPADELTILQSENSLAQAKESKTKAEDDLIKAYEDGYNAVSGAFLDLPEVMSGMENQIYGKTFKDNQSNVDYYADSIDDDLQAYQGRTSVQTTYTTARESYEDNLESYKDTSRFAERAVIEALIDETYETTRDISEAIKNTRNLVDLFVDDFAKRNIPVPTAVSTQQNTLSSYAGTVNSNLSTLLSIRQTIIDSKESIVDAERTIRERTLSHEDTISPPDSFDIRSNEIAIQQRKDALLSAQTTLADYSIRAPFDGVIAKLNIKRGDTVSGSTAAATLITQQKRAEISLNEVDAAKIAVGQKVTLSFDALEDVTLTGSIAEIDSLGTVTQGVVTYDVVIAFDTQDDRIKPGMTVTTTIITDAKQNVVSIPNSAVKSQGEGFYVEVLNAAGVPERKSIEIGIANDIATEITNGLEEGDEIITQTITTSDVPTPTTGSNSLFPGGGGGGGFRPR